MSEANTNKVLIVDDTKLGRLSVKKSLMNLGISNIVELADGSQVVETLKSEGIDLVLMDVLMPGQNGTDTLLQIKDAGIDVKIVMVSADIQDSTRNRCLEYGARSFLNKPVKEDQLKTVLEELELL